MTNTQNSGTISLEKIRVAFYFGALNRGGAETLALDVLSHHNSLPFEAVCLYRNEGVLSQQMASTGVRMVRIPRKRSWIAYLWRLSRAIKANGIDILHAQTSLNAILAIVCSWFTGAKVVTTFHGFGYVNAPKALRRLIFRGSDRIVFVSEGLKQAFVKRGVFGCEKKIMVVPNGVNFSKLKLRENSHSIDKKIEMCMVGSFGEGRNHMLVCRFLHLLEQEGVDFHFTFVGASRPKEMELYNQCVDYCKNNGLDEKVTFAGLCDNVPDILDTMDAFIYSTRHDSFGLAVIEAISTGVPTFVNDWCTMVEITHNGRWATLFKSDDETSLLTAFKDFLSHREEYLTKARKNAIEVREAYGIEKHISALQGIYQSIV